MGVDDVNLSMPLIRGVTDFESGDMASRSPTTVDLIADDTDLVQTVAGIGSALHSYDARRSPVA